MNRPPIPCYEDMAIDTVVNVVNVAMSRVGVRQDLYELSSCRDLLRSKPQVTLSNIERPILEEYEKFIENTISNTWKMASKFKYALHILGSSVDESSSYYYYEAIFSQPTPRYPIPQATVSVFFTIKKKLTLPPDVIGVPEMTFRIEGDSAEKDARFVRLTEDSILAHLKMKLIVFKRIEALDVF